MFRYIAVFLAFPIASLTSLINPSTFTAPGEFPTSAFSKYFNNPTQTASQVQPVISDPVSHVIYPLSLTDPDTIPGENNDPHPLPPVVSSQVLLQNALTQLLSIATNPSLNNSCGRCQATLELAKFLALAAPDKTPTFLIALCNQLKLSNDCTAEFTLNGMGSVVTQVIANADVGGYDGQALCFHFFGNACPSPPTVALNLTGWFAKPKPNPLPPPKKRSGNRLKVLHLSDFHIDPRYSTGTEANCSSGLCCRPSAFNTASPHSPIFPAPRYGSFLCDTPFALALAAMEAIPALTGTKETGFDYSIFTGDLVSHDPENSLSRSYTEYTETIVFDLIRRMLGAGPVYAALGNHDTYNSAQDAPHSIGGALAQQYSWDYDHISSLWQHEQWIDEAAVELAQAHYSAYMVKRPDGLRVISMNTDMWYIANWFNYINMTNPDVSGLLRFVTDQLQAAEDAGDRVWIIGHVLPGWDGVNGLRNPTNLFYQIVDRFSPHVITNIFFGHTHEDQLSIYYENNGTVQNSATALTPAWIGPSLTPLTNLNSGFRVYEVDSGSHEIMDAHTWKADVTTFPALDSQVHFGPTYAYEYNTREAYGQSIKGWSSDDPLNATWWHLVTEAMDADHSLITAFNNHQGKMSAQTVPCVGECFPAKICYIRSASVPIALANCPVGFGSVQP